MAELFRPDFDASFDAFSSPATHSSLLYIIISTQPVAYIPTGTIHTRKSCAQQQHCRLVVHNNNTVNNDKAWTTRDSCRRMGEGPI